MKNNKRRTSQLELAFVAKTAPNQLSEDFFYQFKKLQPFSLNQNSRSPSSDRPPLYPHNSKQKFIRTTNESFVNHRLSSQRSIQNSRNNSFSSTDTESSKFRLRMNSKLRCFQDHDKENRNLSIDLSKKLQIRNEKNQREIFGNKEKSEALKEYKSLQDKINKISKGKLPSSFLFKLSTKRV